LLLIIRVWCGIIWVAKGGNMNAMYAKFTLQLNTVTDADVIEYLNAQANKNDTIRRALRAKMKGHVRPGSYGDAVPW